MGFIYQKAAQHRCALPEPPSTADGTISPGDVWRCDECRLMHVRIDSNYGGEYWEPMPNGSKLWLQTVKRLDALGVDTTPLFDTTPAGCR